jgi:hypothetical protein
MVEAKAEELLYGQAWLRVHRCMDGGGGGGGGGGPKL